MTTKYILRRYNKDIEASQTIGSGEESTSSYFKNVPTQEITPPIKYKLKDHYIKLQLLLLRLKLETIDLHISKIKREQFVNGRDFIYEVNQRCANSFNVIHEEIISMKEKLKLLREHLVDTFNESTDYSHSKNTLKFSTITKKLNVKQNPRKKSTFQKKKKMLRDSGLNGKYWQFDHSWNRGSASFISVNNNRIARLQRNARLP